MPDGMMLADAEADLRRIARLLDATRAVPDDPEPHCAMSSLLIELGRPRDAVGAALTATMLAPDHPRAQAELGRALVLAGEPAAALEPCARAVVLAPDNVGAMVTFGAALFALGRLDLALEAALDAVALSPEHYQARVNLSLAFEALGELEKAEVQARRAISIEPTAAARHNLAALLLSQGRLAEESWTLYDARLELTARSRALADIPRWRGEDLGQGTILLHAEQGFGDVIQFVRYAPMVKARAGRVLLAAPAPLRRLLETVDGIDEVVEPGVARSFDAFCPVASLPLALRTGLATIPTGIPYLAAPPDAVERFRPKRDGTLQVGLVWSGNPDFVHDRLRSIDPALLLPLRQVEGVSFHCLQKDLAPPFAMRNRMDEVRDFADTAGMVAGLDLVIAVDTAVAHLAGALGRPVWLLSRFMGCWRWLRDREDSPWYPSLRVFRQNRPNDWEGVVAAVAAALASRAAEFRAQEPR